MSAHEQLQKMYDDLPEVDCKGLCWNSCGPIDMSDAEHQRIADLGVDIPEFTDERSQRWSNNEPLYCPALSFKARDGQIGCSVYQDRPLICRIWGIGEDDLACPHGCETTGRLSHAEITSLLMQSFRVGGHEGMADLDQGEEILAELMNDPTYRALVRRFMSGDKAAGVSIRALIEARRNR